MSRHCANCKALNGERRRLCQVCGAQMPTEEMQPPDPWTFCKCGGLRGRHIECEEDR